MQLSKQIFSILLLVFVSVCFGQTAPFTESFDAWGLPAGWRTYNNKNTTTVQDLWQLGSPGVNPMGFNSANVLEHTGNNGYYAWSDGSAVDYLSGIFLETDSIDLSALTNPSLSFYLYSNNTTNTFENVLFYVEVYHGGQWKHLTQHSGNNVDWVHFLLDLNPYKNAGKIVLRFATNNHIQQALYNDIAIDDIKVDNFPSCYFSGPMSVSGASSNSAIVNWPSSSTDSLLYGPIGFNPALSGTLVTATPPFVLSGLSPYTSYSVYVIGKNCSGPRDTLGPYSFNTLCGSSGLSGNYTLGTGSSSSFSNLKDLENALAICGVSGPTTVTLQPGTYQGPLLLENITGLSASNTLTLRGSGGVTIISEGNTQRNFVIALSGSPNITLKNLNLTLKAVPNTSGGAYGTGAIVDVADGSHYFSIDSCTITNLEAVTTGIFLSGGKTVLKDHQFKDLGKSNSFTVSSSTIAHVINAIQVEKPADSSFTRNHQVLNNRFKDFSSGVEMDFANNVLILGNHIVKEPFYLANHGVQISGDSVTVAKNVIKTELGAVGLTTLNSNPSVNNVIHTNIIVSPNHFAIGINGYTDVIHNTIVGYRCLNLISSEGVNILNNIFDARTTSLAAICIYSDLPRHSSAAFDHNLYYRSFGQVAIFNANGSNPNIYTTLASWQSTSINSNSLYGDAFLSSVNNEYRSYGTLANNRGDGSRSFATDIMGVPRPATNVDIGAYEYDTVSNDLRIVEILDMPGVACAASSKTTRAIIQNIGLQPATNYTVSNNVTGPISSSQTTPFAKSLMPLQIDTVVFPLAINADGKYQLTASVQLPNDQNTVNDTLKKDFVVIPTTAPVLQKDTALLCKSVSFDTLTLPLNTVGSYYYWSNLAGDFIGDEKEVIVGPLGINDTVFRLNATGTKYSQVGLSDNSSGGGGYLSANGRLGINFKVHEKCVIDSFQVYPQQNIITLKINIRNRSGLVHTKTFSLTQSGSNVPVTVPLDFEVPPGEYSIDSEGSSISLYRNNQNVNFPYPNKLLSLTSSPNVGFYYFYYNWHVSKNTGCSRPSVDYTIKRVEDSTHASFTAVTGPAPSEVIFNASLSHNADVYAWDFGDGTRDSGKVVSHTYNTSGQFNVVLTTYLPCGTTVVSDTALQVVKPLSLNYIDIASSIKIYPNPSNGQFTIEREKTSGSLSLEVYDRRGARLKKFDISNGRSKMSLNIEKLPVGTYTLKISDGTFETFEKLIKL